MSQRNTALRGPVAVAALALAILLAGLPGSASAAVLGLERVGAASASNSSNKSVTVTCPVGKQVVSAGADVGALSGQVLIDDIRPAPTFAA